MATVYDPLTDWRCKKNNALKCPETGCSQTRGCARDEGWEPGKDYDPYKTRESKNIIELCNELDALAEKATLGPWFMHDFTSPEVNDNPGCDDVTVSCDHPATITLAYMARALTGTLDEARNNANLIAALDPSTVKRLTAVVRAAVELRKGLGPLYGPPGLNLVIDAFDKAVEQEP